MLKNAYFLAKIGADTAENEQHFAEILPKLATTQAVVVPLGAERRRRLAEDHEPHEAAERAERHRA